MDKRTVSPGLIFMLVLLIAVGAFLLYSRLAFTGYVTNVANATTGELLSSHVFDEGDFSNTFVNSEGSVVLMSTKTTGTFTSQAFDAGQEVLWTDFMPSYVSHSSTNYTEDPIDNSVTFYLRACNNLECTEEDFEEYTIGSENLNILGQYFQYRVKMQILSGNQSPSLSEVNVSYYPPYTPPINIHSPTNTIYNNESVLINISSNPGVTLWIYNGTDNELYTAEFNRTFPEGTHVLEVFASYIDGRINYTNTASVTFTVGFLKTFYRFANNACGTVTITQAQKTVNDYTTLTECQSHITTSNTTTTTEETQTTQQGCTPQWECFFNDSAAWSECVDGVQTRICADMNTNPSCVTDISSRPPETQSCTGGTVTTAAVTETPTTETTPTETPKKGFFSFVGSAIVGPVFRSTVGIIVVILVLVLVGGFLVYKFLLKDKLNLKFFKFNKGKKKFSFTKF